MLVISRRIGESFLIGEDIEATVVDISGEKVLLGIQAPREIPIQRTDSENTGGPKASSADKINAKGYGRQYKSKLGGDTPK